MSFRDTHMKRNSQVSPITRLATPNRLALLPPRGSHTAHTSVDISVRSLIGASLSAVGLSGRVCRAASAQAQASRCRRACTRSHTLQPSSTRERDRLERPPPQSRHVAASLSLSLSPLSSCARKPLTDVSSPACAHATPADTMLMHACAARGIPSHPHTHTTTHTHTHNTYTAHTTCARRGLPSSVRAHPHGSSGAASSGGHSAAQPAQRVGGGRDAATPPRACAARAAAAWPRCAR